MVSTGKPNPWEEAQLFLKLKPQLFLSWQHPQKAPCKVTISGFHMYAHGLHAGHFRLAVAITAAFSGSGNPKASQYPAGQKGTLLLLFHHFLEAKSPNKRSSIGFKMPVMSTAVESLVPKRWYLSQRPPSSPGKERIQSPESPV